MGVERDIYPGFFSSFAFFFSTLRADLGLICLSFFFFCLRLELELVLLGGYRGKDL